MARVLVLYDGFNLYHAISNLGNPQLKWLDLAKLSKEFIRPDIDQIVGIKYFSAYPKWNPARTDRHRLYVRVLASLGVQVVMGNFQRVERRCQACGQVYRTFEEKKTDANMVAHVMGEAAKDTFDTAIICSADSDLVAALDGLRTYFPDKVLGFLFPPGLNSYQLRQHAAFIRDIKPGQLRHCLLPQTVQLPTGSIVTCPPEWT